MSDTYRPFVLTSAQCVEIINNRIKRLAKRRAHMKELDQSIGHVDIEIGFLSWLRETIGSSPISFTYHELEQFVGDSREP